jgi:acyl-CoA-dependent ceramide synthase
MLLLILLAAYYISPGEHNPLHSALFLSYADPALHERTNTLPAHIGNPTQYGKGRKDFAFVAFYTIVFTFTREFCMQRLIRPLAIRAGIKSRGKQARFMEQAYTAMYFAVFGPFGLWVMSRTPVWYFNTTGMYEGFPHRAHESYFKMYYLLQAAYWAQQAIVLMLQLEKPRKDFKELVLHHIITLALIGLSYRFHFTYMGIAVYITHDISDFFLAVSEAHTNLESSLNLTISLRRPPKSSTTSTPTSQSPTSSPSSASGPTRGTSSTSKSSPRCSPMANLRPLARTFSTGTRSSTNAGFPSLSLLPCWRCCRW